MNYILSIQELFVISQSLRQEFPLQIVDLLESFSEGKLNEGLDEALEQLLHKGFAKEGSEGEYVLDDGLMECLIGCFKPNLVITIMGQDSASHVYFHSSERTTHICEQNDQLIIQSLGSEFESHWLKQVTDGSQTASTPYPSVSVTVSTERFDQLLHSYNRKKEKKIVGFCENEGIDLGVCLRILEDIHSDRAIVVLTERIGDPGTIYTKFLQKGGGCRLSKSIYTPQGDMTVMAQCAVEQLPSLVTDFGVI